MKICMIVPKGLPLPATKGGAIETLVNDIMDENEKKQQLDLTVVSMYDNDAYKQSLGYKHCHFIYIKKDLLYILTAIKVRLLGFLGRQYNTYNEVVLKKIKKQHLDYIVVEDGAYKLFNSYLKYFDKEKMYLHFHHVGISSKATDESFAHFIGVSDFVVNNFKKTSNIIDFITLKNGINDHIFSQKITPDVREEIRNSFGFTDDDFVILYCGRIIKEKGVLELIKAVNKIKNSHVKLMILGNNDFKNCNTNSYLRDVYSEIDKCIDRVKLTGYIDNKLVYKYYQSADACVIPSICEDAAPLVAVESMSSSLPLIVTQSGGILEYASDNTIVISRDNLTNNLFKSLSSLYNNQELREKMQRSGLIEAKKYTTEKFYNNFVKIFKEKHHGKK